MTDIHRCACVTAHCRSAIAGHPAPTRRSRATTGVVTPDEPASTPAHRHPGDDGDGRRAAPHRREHRGPHRRTRRPPRAGPARSPRATQPADVDNRTGTAAPDARQRGLARAADPDVRWNRLGTPQALGPGRTPLATGLPADPEAAARAYLTANRDLFGLDAAAVAAMERRAGPADRQRRRGHPPATLRRPARRAATASSPSRSPTARCSRSAPRWPATPARRRRPPAPPSRRTPPRSPTPS